MYEIIYSQDAVKQLKKFPKEISARILAALERIRIRPSAYIEKLVGSPYFKLRAGDYRIILDIQQDKLIILVIEVGHRKNIYKR